MNNQGMQLLKEKIQASGYMVVRIVYKDGILEVMAEKEKYKGMNLSHCERLSKIISPFLDAEDLIKELYVLEVTSPGIRRPLITKEDFEHYKGQVIEFTNRESIMYNGTVEEVLAHGVSLKLKDGQRIEVKFASMKFARLLC